MGVKPKKGSVAGFFTFGGIGLIAKGYHPEDGIPLVIELLSLIQLVCFFILTFCQSRFIYNQ